MQPDIIENVFVESMVTETRPSLEQRIQRLEDIEAIKQLKSMYLLYINDCHYHRVSELFTEDAVIDMSYMHPSPNVWRGRAEIAKWYNVMAEGSLLSQLKQFLHNHTITVDGDTASGWSLLEARYGIVKQSYNVAAKYEETYARVDGTWLFKTLQLKVYYSVPMEMGWSGENRHHLVQRPGYAGVPFNGLKPNEPV